MKFATQHRKFLKGKALYFAHRDGASCWITSGDGKKGSNAGSKVFDTVAQAKAWINHPVFF